MRLAVCIGLSLAALIVAQPLVGQTLGRFEGPVVVEWLVDDSGPDRDMRLVESFTFVDANGRNWMVPVGAVVDGASIPQALWTFIGPPFVGDYRRAAVVHDYYCHTKSRTWQAVHRMFFDAMLASRVPRSRALLLYAGVYGGGPRWSRVAGVEPGQEQLTTETFNLSEGDLQALQDWITIHQPTLSELEDQVRRVLDQ